MAQNYEDLVGGIGRNAVYRGERVQVVDIIDPKAAQLRVSGRSYPVFDISLNGLSFLTDDTVDLPGEGGVSRAQLLLHNEVVYDGKIQVVRYGWVHRKARIGVKLVSGFLDISSIRSRAEEAHLEYSLEYGPLPDLKKVPQDYRIAIETLAYTVQFYRMTLGRPRPQNGARPVYFNSTDALIDKGVASVRGPWAEGVEQATEAAQSFLQDPTTLVAAKRYTETILTSLLLDAPGINRAYTKPLGYAGDYQTMIYMYEDTFEGETPFARVFHKICTEDPMAAAVRTRKSLLLEFHKREYARAAKSESDLTVLNLGCGPATEAIEFSRDFASPSQRVHWTLIDQEEKALSLAHRQTYEHHTSQDRGSAQCLYVSFSQLLQDSGLLSSIPEHDFVYCAGLFDYLKPSLAKLLAKLLWAKVKPGGLLAIGNAIKPSPCFWFAEMVLDWTLIYRTREEMLALFEGLPGLELAEVEAESANVFHFVTARKSLEPTP